MPRHSVLVLIALCACAGGCASRGSVADLGKRMVFLEREVLATRTEGAALKDEAHELDLRVEYLEREALKRGEAVAPRKGIPSAPPADDTAEARAERPATVKSPAAPRPAAKAPASATPLETTKKASPVSVQTDAEAHPTTLPSPTPSPAVTSESAGTAEPFTVSTAIMTPEVPSVALPHLTESTPSTPAPPAAPSKAPARPEQKAYDTALQMYRTGRYAEAEAAFQAFLEVYPGSRLVPNALYWKGETYYSRGRYTDAIFAFKDVQTRFPRDAKTPDSLLKTAMAYQKMGDAANASLHLSVLYEDWPKAEAAQRARRMGLKP